MVFDQLLWLLLHWAKAWWKWCHYMSCWGHDMIQRTMFHWNVIVEKSRILQNKIILWTGLQPTASKLSSPVHRLAVPLLSSHQLAGLCQTSANFLMSKCYCSALVFWAAYQAISWSHENMIFFMTLYPFTFLSISRDTLYLSPGRKGFSCTKPYLCRSNIGFRFETFHGMAQVIPGTWRQWMRCLVATRNSSFKFFARWKQ